MKFSIIVPVYNVEKFLPYCLESILNQSFNDFELILINDGSTDESLSICEKYATLDKRVVIINQENGGPSCARNSGIKIAKGNYYVFVDGDDALSADALSTINNNINGKDFILYSFNNIDENNNVILENKNFLNEIKNINDLKERALSSDRVGAAWLKCVSKSYFNGEIASILFDDSTNFGEDQIYTCDLLTYVKDIAIINEPLYEYRIRLGSLMTSYKADRMIYREYYLDHLKNYLQFDEWNIENKEKLFNHRVISVCISEMLDICGLTINKKEKLQLMKQVRQSKYFDSGHFDRTIFIKSIVYLIIKLKMFRSLMLIYKIGKKIFK